MIECLPVWQAFFVSGVFIIKSFEMVKYYLIKSDDGTINTFIPTGEDDENEKTLVLGEIGEEDKRNTSILYFEGLESNRVDVTVNDNTDNNN